MKPSPTISSAAPASSMKLRDRSASPTCGPITARLVEPVAPKTSATPYRKKALEKAPSRKYFSDASEERGSSRSKPTST